MIAVVSTLSQIRYLWKDRMADTSGTRTRRHGTRFSRVHDGVRCFDNPATKNLTGKEYGIVKVGYCHVPKD